MTHNLRVAYATGKTYTYHTTNRDRVRAIKRAVKKVAALSGVPVVFKED
jgi:hypothetical protein